MVEAIAVTSVRRGWKCLGLLVGVSRTLSAVDSRGLACKRDADAAERDLCLCAVCLILRYRWEHDAGCQGRGTEGVEPFIWHKWPY